MRTLALTLASALLIAASTAQAANLALLPGNPVKGKKIVQEKCTACHARLVGGDGSTIYTRPDHRVKSIEGLMGQVARCDQQLETRLSNEDKDNVIIYLNQAYYRF